MPQELDQPSDTHDRSKAKPAPVFTNAPLTLIQTDLLAKVEFLKWMLEPAP